MLSYSIRDFIPSLPINESTITIKPPATPSHPRRWNREGTESGTGDAVPRA